MSVLDNPYDGRTRFRTAAIIQCRTGVTTVVTAPRIELNVGTMPYVREVSAFLWVLVATCQRICDQPRRRHTTRPAPLGNK